METHPPPSRFSYLKTILFICFEMYKFKKKNWHEFHLGTCGLAFSAVVSPPGPATPRPPPGG